MLKNYLIKRSCILTAEFFKSFKEKFKKKKKKTIYALLFFIVLKLSLLFADKKSAFFLHLFKLKSLLLSLFIFIRFSEDSILTLKLSFKLTCFLYSELEIFN